MGFFETEIPPAVVLALFIPLIITQLFVGHSQRAGLARFWGSPLD